MCARTLKKKKNKTKKDKILRRRKKSRLIGKNSSIRKVQRERGGWPEQETNNT
jgi:hypothetical protein